MRKRSNEKRFTKRARILRQIRISQGISQREAARRCELSESAIGHYENGRMEVSEQRLALFLEAYAFSRVEFERFLEVEVVPMTSIRNECFHWLKQLDDKKLRAIHAVLEEFIHRR